MNRLFLKFLSMFVWSWLAINTTRAQGFVPPAAQNGDVSLNDFGKVLMWVTQWVLSLAPTVGIIMVMYGGVLYMWGSLTDNTENGRRAITYAVVGFVVAALSWFVVDLIQRALTEGV